jgi:hypothetical protein
MRAIRRVWHNKMSPIARGCLIVKKVNLTAKLTVSKINCVKTEGSL